MDTEPDKRLLQTRFIFLMFICFSCKQTIPPVGPQQFTLGKLVHAGLCLVRVRNSTSMELKLGGFL